MTEKHNDIRDDIRSFEQGYISPDGDNPIRELGESDRDTFRKAKEATMALLDATNVMGSEKAVQAGVVAGILGTHRYLQSQGIFAILTALGEFGRSGCNTDARNEAAKDTCNMLVSALRERIYWPVGR